MTTMTQDAIRALEALFGITSAPLLLHTWLPVPPSPLPTHHDHEVLGPGYDIAMLVDMTSTINDDDEPMCITRPLTPLHSPTPEPVARPQPDSSLVLLSLAPLPTPLHPLAVVAPQPDSAIALFSPASLPTPLDSLAVVAPAPPAFVASPAYSPPSSPAPARYSDVDVDEQRAVRLRLTGGVRLVIDLLESPFRVRVDDGAPPCSVHTESSSDGSRWAVVRPRTHGGSLDELEHNTYDGIELEHSSQLRFVYAAEDSMDKSELLVRMHDAFAEFSNDALRFVLVLKDSAQLRAFPSTPLGVELAVACHDTARLRGHEACFVHTLRVVVGGSGHVEGLHATHALHVTSHSANAHADLSYEPGATHERLCARRKSELTDIKFREISRLARVESKASVRQWREPPLLPAPPAVPVAAAAVADDNDVTDRDIYNCYVSEFRRRTRQINEFMMRCDTAFPLPPAMREVSVAAHAPLGDPYHTRLQELYGRWHVTLNTYDEWCADHQQRALAEQRQAAAAASDDGAASDNDDNTSAATREPSTSGRPKRRVVVRRERTERAMLKRSASSLELEAPAAPASNVSAPTCVVCRTNEVRIVVLPCKHMPYCVECKDAARALAITDNVVCRCPLCRTEIKGLLEIKPHW